MNYNHITLEHVSKSFKQGTITTTVLHDISFVLEQNNSYALTGISGTGKSTLIHIIAGLEQPSGGSVYINNQNITQLTQTGEEAYLLSHIGLIFQNAYLLPDLSVIENVMLKGLIARQDYAKAHTRAQELLRAVGLEHKACCQPLQLSGGEQQRVAIARALFGQPQFLIADEPTAHLDEENRAIILEVLKDCQKQWHMGLIIASHDPVVAAAMQTHLVLTQGQLVQASS